MSGSIGNRDVLRLIPKIHIRVLRRSSAFRPITAKNHSEQMPSSNALNEVYSHQFYWVKVWFLFGSQCLVSVVERRVLVTKGSTDKVLKPKEVLCFQLIMRPSL
jgi:hypothetical protein